LLAVKAMGGENTEAWRAAIDDLIQRGLRRPDFLFVDGALGLEAAIAAVWGGVPVQRRTVHKHRNLLALAPERLREEISSDCNDMIYAATREEIETRRKAFIRKWRLKYRADDDSLQEAEERLFTFTCRQSLAQRSHRIRSTSLFCAICYLEAHESSHGKESGPRMSARPRSHHRRSSLPAPVRRLPGPCGCQRLQTARGHVQRHARRRSPDCAVS
jgi:hypothetical protein